MATKIINVFWLTQYNLQTVRNLLFFQPSEFLSGLADHWSILAILVHFYSFNHIQLYFIEEYSIEEEYYQGLAENIVKEIFKQKTENKRKVSSRDSLRILSLGRKVS